MVFLLATAAGQTAFAQPPAAEVEPTTPPEAVAPAAPTADDAPPSDDQIGRAEFLRGRHAYDGGDYATALDAFQRALDLTGRVALYYNVGLAHDRLRHDDEALAAYRRFLAEVAEAPERAQVEGRVAALERALEERRARAAEDAEAAAARERELERLRNESKPSRWWIGLIVGVVVVGVVTAVVVTQVGGDDGLAQGDFGPATRALVSW